MIFDVSQNPLVIMIKDLIMNQVKDNICDKKTRL